MALNEQARGAKLIELFLPHVPRKKLGDLKKVITLWREAGLGLPEMNLKDVQAKRAYLLLAAKPFFDELSSDIAKK